jgi:tRNA(fMet)-specific endonuclease VapC
MVTVISEYIWSMARKPVRKRTLALICGQIRTKLQKLGTPIGSYDLQIAAIALANDLILVTHNTREFERVEGLKLEDWQE